MQAIVADTTPLNYLVLLQAADILPNLYRTVLIPPSVKGRAGSCKHFSYRARMDFDPAEIKAKRVKKQKTDRKDAQLLLRLMREDNFPRVWVPSKENRDLRQLLWHRHRLVRRYDLCLLRPYMRESAFCATIFSASSTALAWSGLSILFKTLIVTERCLLRISRSSKRK
jgi:hypothetical protein